MEGALSLYWALALLLAGCARSYLSSGTQPLIATSTPSEIPGPTQVAPSETPEPSLTPPPSALLADSSVDQPFALAWSPRGDLIGVTTTTHLLLLDSGDLVPVRIIPASKPLRHLDFSPAGDRVAAYEDGVNTYVWDSATGQLLQTLGPVINWMFLLTYGEDGTLYVAVDEGVADRVDIFVFPVEGTSGILSIPSISRDFPLAIAPRGAIVAVGQRPSGIEIWGPGPLEPRQLIESPQVESLEYGPDGNLLAAAQQDCWLRLWDVAAEKAVWESPWCDLRPAGGIRIPVSFTRDGEALALANHEGVILVWDVASGDFVETIGIAGSQIISLSFSPDGTKLASIGEDGLLQIWAVGP